MVIGSIVFNFVDLDLRVEISFKKEGAAENGGYRHQCKACLFCFFIVSMMIKSSF